VGGNTGTQMGGWFRKEIKTPEDFQGLKFRIGGWAGKTIAKLGGVPQQIAGGELYAALEKGTIDAAEWVGPYDDERLGLNRVAKYYYYPGWWEGGAALHFFINTAKWDSLPKNYQAVVTAASALANVEMQAKYDARNPIALRKLLNNGTQLRLFSEATLDACLKASNEVNAETAASNADFKRIYEAMVGFRNSEYIWWQVSEYSYDNFMIRSRRQG
jgi:TRAP-type mannitol/chloroaromatic compound transport system substrate-binding protein